MDVLNKMTHLKLLKAMWKCIIYWKIVYMLYATKANILFFIWSRMAK